MSVEGYISGLPPEPQKALVALCDIIRMAAANVVGTYRIDAPLSIDGAQSLNIRDQGWRSVIANTWPGVSTWSVNDVSMV